MMFTRRHEQELAQIKRLVYDLDQHSREALDRLGRIHEAYESQFAHESIRDEINALANRYGLDQRTADALQGLMRLVDSGLPNFVPRSTPSGPKRETRGLPVPSRSPALTVLADSLAGLELEAMHTARRVADIGSGAGFPGLVLAIALPRARVSLIERVHARCEFLRGVADELKLENVEVVEGDMQQWSAGVGSCDLVTSRKVGRLKTIVGWSAPLLTPGGAVALWPGRTDFPEKEVAAAADAAEAAGLRLVKVLPIESENHAGRAVVKHLHLYEKDLAAETP